MRRPPKGWALSSFNKRSSNNPQGKAAACFDHQAAPGLVVNPHDSDDWVVSHARSGLFINPSFPTAELACSFALSLADAGDFTRSARELLADLPLIEDVKLIRQRPEFLDGSALAIGLQYADDIVDAILDA